MMTSRDDPYFGNKSGLREDLLNVYTSELQPAAFGLT